MLGKTITAVFIPAAPFHERSNRDAAPCIATKAAYEVVNEDKLEGRPVLFQRFCQPAVLRFAECHAPAVLAFAFACKPKGVEHDEQRIPPLPGIVVLQQAGS